MARVMQDKNGVVYLHLTNLNHMGVEGVRAIVNKGKKVAVVFIDNDTVTSLYLQPITTSVVEVANLLLHPTNKDAIVTSAAQHELGKCIKEEVDMAKKAAVEAPAEPKKGKFAKVTAPAASNHKGEVGTAQTLADLKGNDLYQTKVVTTGKGAEAREGSLWKTVHELAGKPIVLADLISAVAEKMPDLKSEKDKETVIRVRVRDGFTRLEYLKAT